MGTWGCNIFENDDSCDFVENLGHNREYEDLRDALERVLKNHISFSVYDSHIALAATSVIKGIVTGDYETLPPNVIEWAKTRKTKDFTNLIQPSLEAIEKIKRNSELREEWSNTPEFLEWLKVIENLEYGWPQST